MSRVVSEAAGVVACVTPWNYPLMQARSLAASPIRHEQTWDQ